MQVIKSDGSREPFSLEKVERQIAWAAGHLPGYLEKYLVILVRRVEAMSYNGIKTSKIMEAVSSAALSLIKETDDESHSYVAASLLSQELRKRIAGGIDYGSLRAYVTRGIAEGQLDTGLLSFDLELLDGVIDPERDRKFDYLGLKTLADRYFIRAQPREIGKDGDLIELPQHFFMRVAMGLALAERADKRDAAAASFYDLLSNFNHMTSTPTLFNSGTTHPQLSSCYLNTVADTISAKPGTPQFASIFGTMEECANLSKYAGGIGTDWCRVRSMGELIKGTNGKSAGVIPYIKISNDTAVAVNQGGKRNGSFSPSLEPWHPDFLAFLDLKNSGDDHFRAHDVFPHCWVPDLFMKRVMSGEDWSFFPVVQCSDLHELYGDAFEARYVEYERAGMATSKMPANLLWQKMLTALFETGHPWICFKDECNRRSPQDHMGVVHSSNLCTEITLNTSDKETAVCNLGSINLANHVTAEGVFDFIKLEESVTTAVRMLDNVIDINFYPSERARTSNIKHRPVGLGMMGYTEALVKMGIDWESQEHLEFADELTEAWSFYAIKASAQLSAERGPYMTYEGSKWQRGILPIDTANADAKSLTQRSYSKDWDWLRSYIKAYGMRNSNVMAIAPTATISNIIKTTPCIEPIFEYRFVKGNMSGKFVVMDPCLKYGRRELCKLAHNINPHWLIKAAAVRQKWIDQSQSLNIYAKQGIRGKDLAEIYQRAWSLGVKTTYYLRMQAQTVHQIKPLQAPEQPSAGLCSISSPECESCQ